jgi:predicted transcriptional regulator
MTPEQCRMARAGLHMSQVELARRAGVAPATIAEFEKGRRIPYGRTVRDIQRALEEAGINFVNGGVSLDAEPRS